MGLDVNPGPLAAARRNGEKYGVGERLRLRLSDGLRQAGPQEGSDIVMAGMGGELILRLVGETLWLRDGAKRLVLQPMSSVPQLRLGLQELGFAVLEEQAVEDGGKIYSAFAAQYQGQVPDPGPLYPYLGKLTPGAPWVDRYGEKVLRDLENQARGARHRGEEERAAALEEVILAIRREYLGEKGD